jgi:hypothetical protein
MERKLELKDICGYLPHRLKATDDDGWHIYDLTNISLFQGIFKADICQQVNDDFFDEGKLLISDLTPIFRPSSDLYKTITHNGKEIIPIVELAKMAFPLHSPKWYLGTHKVAGVPCAISEGDKFDFIFDEYGFSAYWTNPIIAYPENPHKLYDFLHELKIDYRGLIDSGLAIDCNTLENNPYK